MPSKDRPGAARSRPDVSRVASPHDGVPRFGGTKVPPFDVFGGFHSLRTALQRQIGVCEKCLLRDAGREAAASFLRSVRDTGQLPLGEDGFRAALEAYGQAGFGDFRILGVDWSEPRVEIVGREAFEGRAFARRDDVQAVPACDYTCGAIEGFLLELLRLEGRLETQVRCRETACVGTGRPECLYVAGSVSSVARIGADAALEGHRHASGAAQGAPAAQGAGLPVTGGSAWPCEVIERNDALEARVASMSERISDYERLLANILMNSADAIISMDPERRILTWNHGAESMYGYRADEMIGKPFEVLVPPDLLAAGELARIDALVQASGALRGYETERLTRDGRRITVELSCSDVRDSRGRRLGRSVIHRDITERKRLERELIQSEKLSAIGKLSAHVAHEVRNPLSSIRLNLELLRDEFEGGQEGLDLDEATVLIQAIQGEVEVLTRFTDEYLQFARLPRLQRTAVEPAGLVEELTQFLHQEAARRSVELRTRLEPDVPEVSADVTKLRQVLLNLARNALDAMPQGGTMEFTVRAGAGYVEIGVHDTGGGIPESVRPHLFEPFFTTKEGGTGLGLSLSQQILREHGGSLEYTTVPGQGTAFTLRLALG